MAKRIGVARCSFCGYKTTTGGIDEHAKNCSKNPKNSNPMNSLQKKAEEATLKNFHTTDYETNPYYLGFIAGYLAGQQKTATGEPGEDQEGL